MEEWIAWDPVKLNSEYFYVSMTDVAGLEITLSPLIESGDKVIKICFKGLVQAYRYTEELYTIKTIAFLHEKYEPIFYTRRYFFKVKNSEYIEWFFDMASGITDATDQPYQHFVIFTSDALIDVISAVEPVVEFED